METEELKKFKYAIKAYVPDAIITDVQVSEHLDFVREQFAIILKGFIWGSNLETIQYPRDWWQAFKERWFPEWLLDRYPVIYTKVDVNAKYPEYRYLPEDKFGKHIVFTTKYEDPLSGF